MFRGQSLNELSNRDRRFTLAPEELVLVNPNTHTCPVFRNRRDVELTLGIYRRVPVMIAEGPPEVNPWGIKLTTMFHMTNDSGLFRTATECEQFGAVLDSNIYRHSDGRSWLPLYEGKMVNHFNHRYGDHRDISSERRAHVLPATQLTRLQDPFYATLPWYWVAETEVRRWLSGRWDRNWFLGFRDIGGSRADSRTFIAAAIPKVAVSNNLPLLLSEASAPRLALLGAGLSSFAFDFITRQKVGGNHLNFFIVEQLPVLGPDVYDDSTPWDTNRSLSTWLTPRVLELTYTAWDMAGFAKDLGFDGPPFRWEADRRSLLRAELDACFFRLYGIERDDVAYIMDTFPIVRKTDESAHGEYRTARLILERYDEMSKAMESGVPYRGVFE